MAIGAFIIARLSSSRLPEKALMGILGKPMIEHMARRVRAAGTVDKVIITTSDEPSDDPLEELASRLKIGCYRGSLQNIMERITGAAKAYDCDVIVELLGDNPLVHSELIDDVVKFHSHGKNDYAATVTNEYPLFGIEKKLFSVGVRVQVYSRVVAERYVEYPEYMRNDDKHPCAYIFDNPEAFKIGYLEAKGKWGFLNKPELTFAVNYRKNFNLIRAIFEYNYPEDKNFPLENVFMQLNKEKYLYTLMGS